MVEIDRSCRLVICWQHGMCNIYKYSQKPFYTRLVANILTNGNTNFPIRFEIWIGAGKFQRLVFPSNFVSLRCIFRWFLLKIEAMWTVNTHLHYCWRHNIWPTLWPKFMLQFFQLPFNYITDLNSDMYLKIIDTPNWPNQGALEGQSPYAVLGASNLNFILFTRIY